MMKQLPVFFHKHKNLKIIKKDIRSINELSNKIYETCLCIPSSSNLKVSEIKKICKTIKKIANNKF